MGAFLGGAYSIGKLANYGEEEAACQDRIAAEVTLSRQSGALSTPSLHAAPPS